MEIDTSHVTETNDILIKTEDIISKFSQRRNKNNSVPAAVLAQKVTANKHVGKRSDRTVGSVLKKGRREQNRTEHSGLCSVTRSSLQLNPRNTRSLRIFPEGNATVTWCDISRTKTRIHDFSLFDTYNISEYMLGFL